MVARVRRSGRPVGPVSRLLLALTVVAAGLIAPVLGASPADAAPATVPCSATHHTKNGHREYDCVFYLKTTVFSGPHHLQGKVGTIHGGTNWVLCQAVGETVHYGRSYNDTWAYTLSDQHTWGWVNAVFARGGANDGRFGGVPTCGRTTRYDGEFYPDAPPQKLTATGGRFSCEVYDDPFADVWDASCQRFRMTDGGTITHAYARYQPTVACDLESDRYEGRQICRISGLY